MLRGVRRIYKYLPQNIFIAAFIISAAEITTPTGEKNEVPYTRGISEIAEVINDSTAILFAAVFFGFTAKITVIIRITQVIIAVIKGAKFA